MVGRGQSLGPTRSQGEHPEGRLRVARSETRGNPDSPQAGRPHAVSPDSPVRKTGENSRASKLQTGHCRSCLEYRLHTRNDQGRLPTDTSLRPPLEEPPGASIDNHSLQGHFQSDEPT